MSAFLPLFPALPLSPITRKCAPSNGIVRKRPRISRMLITANQFGSFSGATKADGNDGSFPELSRSLEAGSTVISVVEECGGFPWQFRGRRLYMVDLDMGECDVLEDKASITTAAGIQKADATDGPFLRFLRSFLLPAGWPDSVSEEYSNWVKWHIMRQLFRNSYYVLGTTSLLSSLGLGTHQALAVGATLQWVLKDGLGMGTKLLVSTQLASVVDGDPKRFRMIGDTLMALSAGVEILSVTHPAYFLLYGTFAALLKEAGGAMSGPSYRVFLDSFAINSNIGDVSSRGEGQVVIGNLLGLGLGASLSMWLGCIEGADRLIPTICVYALLAFSHLCSTFNGVSTVQLRTLNWQRLNIVIDEFLATGKIPSVAEVNKSERFIYAFAPPPSRKRLRLGAQLLDFVECGRDVSRALRNRADKFVVAYNKRCVGIMLRNDMTPVDLLRGILQGKSLLGMVDGISNVESQNREQIGDLTNKSYKRANEEFPQFLRGLEEQGWLTEKLLIFAGESRYREGTRLDA